MEKGHMIFWPPPLLFLSQSSHLYRQHLLLPDPLRHPWGRASGAYSVRLLGRTPAESPKLSRQRCVEES